MKKFPDIDRKTAQAMARAIDEVCDRFSHGDSDNNIDKLMSRLGIDFDDYRLISAVGMPAIQYCQLYRRTRKWYRGIKKDIRDLCRSTKAALADGADEGVMLDSVLRSLDAIYAEYNHGYENLTTEESGVLEDDE